MTVAVTLTSCDAEERRGSVVARDAEEDVQALAPVITRAGENVQVDIRFASAVDVLDDGSVSSSSVIGDMDGELRANVARPYRNLGRPTLYVEQASEFGSDEEGVTRREYRVWSYSNTTLADPEPTSGTPIVSPGLTQYLTSGAAESTLRLELHVRDFPDWDVPLPPEPLALSPPDVETQAALRATALDEREALFLEMSDEVAAFIEAAGGVIVWRDSKIGWLSADLPLEVFSDLAARNDIDKLDGPYGKSGGSQWSLGEGIQASYLNLDNFFDAGYDGDAPNSSRHSYGRVTIGITESGGYENGACAFRDAAGCASTSRVLATYRCDAASSTCATGTVDTNTNDDVHGTLVAACAAADYTDGQADGISLGDAAWGSNSCTGSAQCNGQACASGRCTHSPSWENNASGMAPEAALILLGRASSDIGASFVSMLSTSIGLNVDITNSSWTWGDATICDLDSSSAIEDTVEVAFDNGVLPVVAAGNLNGDNLVSCSLGDPADTPKALAVNSYDASLNNCETSPSTRCLLDQSSCPMGAGCSARGGISATVVGVGTVAGAVTGIGLVAPNNIGSVTSSTSGSAGVPNNGFTGTSAAAPHVAGLAASLKDRYLTTGQTWINDPGKLQTIMLAMGDRHRSADPSNGGLWTTQMVASADPWYGAGRVRMRMLENGADLVVWGANLTTFVGGANEGFGYYPFGQGPLSTSVQMVKCVMLQIEDMSAKNQVSRMSLNMRIRTSTQGSCGGAVVASRFDATYDLKKMTTIDAFTFTNKCVEVEVTTGGVTAQGAAAHVYCYYAGIKDDVAQ